MFGRVFLVLGGVSAAALCVIIVRFGLGPARPIDVRYPGAATVLVPATVLVAVAVSLVLAVSISVVLGLPALPRAGRSRSGVTAHSGFDP